MANASLASESKKEAFRKYLNSSGVLDALTKVLVALYEENDKPLEAIEYMRRSLGGPTISDFEKLQEEKRELQEKHDKLLSQHEEVCRHLEELQGSTLPEITPSIPSDNTLA